MMQAHESSHQRYLRKLARVLAAEDREELYYDKVAVEREYFLLMVRLGVLK